MSGAGTKTAARQAFDRWAGTYERDPLSRWIAARQRQALDALELRADDHFLDVGCGTGAATRAAAQVVERAVGVDLSPGMLAEARERAAALARAEFVEGDSEQLPFADGEFTAVLCTTSLHHYPRAEVAAREMARVLAPGGRVLLGDPTTDSLLVKGIDLVLRRVERGHVGLRPVDELRRLLEGAGLGQVDTRSLWRGMFGYALARKPG